MAEPKRITGFMILAKDIINEEPGLTAQEVYSRAKRRSVDPLSASANPESSLVATLHKTYEDHGLERCNDGGRFRYYPKGQGPYITIEYPPSSAGERNTYEEGRQPKQQVSGLGGSPQSTYSEDDGGCCIELPFGDRSKIRALVDLGLYTNEHKAHSDLAKKGLEAFVARIAT